MPNRPSEPSPAAELRALRRTFRAARGGGEVLALDGVDLEIARGEIFGLLGPNGAGKTTLISILAGLTRADRGSARILGHDVVADFRLARRSLGVVPQELVFDPFFSVRETLVFQSMLRGSNGAIRTDPDYPFTEREIFDHPSWPKMHFVEHEYAHDWTNWWIPNRACAEAMLRSSGFEPRAIPGTEVYVCRRVDRPTSDGAVHPAHDPGQDRGGGTS